MRKSSPPKSKLAGYSSRGKIWINKKIKGADRKRLRIHEKFEYAYRKKTGAGYKKAHKKALKVEMRGMTRRQKAKYSGRLGAIARWYPAKRRK